jgi:hypothetical protein
MRAMRVNKWATRAPRRVTPVRTAALLKVAKAKVAKLRAVKRKAARPRVATKLKVARMPVVRSAAPVVVRAAQRAIRVLLGARVRAQAAAAPTAASE